MQQLATLARNAFTNTKRVANVGFDKVFANKIKALSSILISGVAIASANNDTPVSNTITVTSGSYETAMVQNDHVKVTCRKLGNDASCELLSKALNVNFRSWNANDVFKHIKEDKDIKELYHISEKPTPTTHHLYNNIENVNYAFSKSLKETYVRRQNEEVRIDCYQLKNPDVSNEKSTSCKLLCKAMGSMCAFNTTNPETILKSLKANLDIKNLYTIKK